jgi:hypothetical protein
MPIYEIEAPDGRIYEIEGPKGATLEQLVNVIRENEQSETPTGPEPDFIDQIEEMIKGVPSGIVGLGELAALGLISPLGEESELEARQAIQETAAALRSPFEADPGSEEAVGRKFGEALGSFVGLGATTLIPGVGIPAAVALAGGAGAGEASERARAAGASAEERATSAALGTVVGLSELIPINVLGRLRRGLGDEGLKGIMQRVKRAAVAGGAEGAQEAAAGIAQNLIEAGVYNPEQGAFTDTGEAFGYGAGVGGFVQGILDLALPKTRGRGAPDPEETSDDSVEETLALGFDPAATITFEDGSTAQVTRSEAEELGLDFDAVVRANELQAEAIAEDEARRAAIPDFPGQQVPDQVMEDALAQAEVLEATRLAEQEAAARKMPVVVEQDRTPDSEVLEVSPEGEVGAVGTFLTTAQREELSRREQSALDRELDRVPEDIRVAKEEREARKFREQEGDLFAAERMAAEQEGLTAAQRRAIPESARPAVDEKPETPKQVTKKFFDDLGIAPSADIRRQIQGEKVNDAQLREKLVGYANLKSTPNKAKTNINQFLDTTPEEGRYAQVQQTGQLVFNFRAKPTPRQEAPIQGEPDVSDDRGTQQEPSGVSIPDTGRVAEGELQPASDTAPAVSAEGVTAPPVRGLGDAGQRAGTFAFGTTGLGDTLAKKIREVREVRVAKEAKKVEDDAKAKALEAEDRQRAEAKKKAAERAKRAKAKEEEVKKVEAAKRRAAKKKVEEQRKADVAKLQGQSDFEDSKAERKRLVEERYNELKTRFAPKNEAEEKNLRTRARREIAEEGGMSLFNVQYNPDLDEALGADTVAMLKEGDLKGALESIAKTIEDTTLARHAKNLAKYVGDTRIVVVPRSPSDATGRLYRGRLDDEPNSTGMFLFDDKIAELNNVIVVDETLGLTPANVLHEMTHAATHATIQNKSNPIRNQLNAIFETVRDSLSDVYGFTNLDEFVAEAYSNPEFQQKLATIRLKGDKVTVWQKIKNIFGNFIRRLQGKDTVAIDTIPADTTVNRMIDDILAPWAGSRGAGTLYNRVSMGRAKEFLNDAVTSIPAFDKDSEATLKERLLASFPVGAKRFALSLLDLNAIVKMSSERIPKAKDLLDIIRKQSGEVNTMLDKAEALYKDVGEWSSNNQEKASALTKLMGRSTLLRVDPSLTKEQAKKKYIQKDRNGRILDDEEFKVWESMQPEWNGLGQEGQTYYKRWRTAYRSMYDEIVNVLDSRLKEDGVNPQARKTAVNELYRKLTDNGIIDPYFPLIRQGKVWLEYNAVDPETGNVEYYVEAFETKAERKKAMRQIKEHWTNPEPKYKSVIEAEIKAAKQNPDNKGKSQADIIQSVSKISEFSDISKASYKNAPPASFVNDVLGVLNSSGASEQTQEDIMRLYLDALPERSFAQSFRNRKDRRGFMGDVTPLDRQVPAGDMFKAYRDRAYNISHQVARVKYGAQINAFQAMLNEEKGNLKRKDIPQEEKALNELYIEELEARAQWAANPVVQNWAKVATGMGFNATLGLNLSSALVNLSQLPMVTLPYLGGQYGFREATKAMGRASKLFMASGRVRGVDSYGVEVGKDIQSKQGALWSLDNYDFSDPNLDPEIKRYETLVKVASEQGQLNRSIAYDILDLGDITNPMAKINAVTGFFFHHGERMNRQISMAAAYDLALNKMKSDGRKIDEAARQEAAIEAINVTEMTNGGIAAASAPRFAQDGLGKVVFLFKRYASAMYFMLGSLAYRSIKGSDADRAMARRQLAGVFGGAGLVAGIQGLPLFGVLAMMHDLFKEDDEEDFETSVRQYFGEGMYGGLGNYLFGVDVASRMGLSNLVFRDRLIEKDQSILWTTAEMLGGPVVGTALQVERGFDQIADGEVARGIETAMPAAIRNILKSRRFATEGAETLRGDPIVEDIGPGHIFAQAVGFAPADYTLQLQKNAQIKKIDRAVNEERTKLLKKYYVALRNADGLTMSEIAKDIVDFNSRHPVVAITPKTIRRSMKQHMRTTAKMYHGITVSPRRRAEALDFVSEYDETPNVWYDIAENF